MKNKHAIISRAYARNRSVSADKILRSVSRSHVAYDKSGTIAVLHTRKPEQPKNPQEEKPK